MIVDLISQMHDTVVKLQKALNADYEDAKKANHDGLIMRNEEKEQIVQDLVTVKETLANSLTEASQNGEDIEQYRQKIDLLEIELVELNRLNNQLASVVLPISQMYRTIVDELSSLNGGSIIDVKA